MGEGVAKISEPTSMEGRPMKKSPGVSSVFAVVLLGFALVASASAQAAPTMPDPALAAVFAGASSLPQADLMPKPTLKCGLKCFANLMHTSPTISGSGSSCTNATNSLNTQLHDIAANDCINVRLWDGVCDIVDHDTTACTLIGSGAYQIQGYATYACSINNC
jgi:hypothetical protein